ncbi:hypothetical protein MYAM1_003139 [Malassezia yamatoensis]|uniref:Uncharacterized protein n=1 Tax=Malassezia yamatoensis TaxID=253288 RepID=A0AAJ5Z166_9BASI|nr:hypothetical protein MYAM1_003139 [Malassezia yamatoensis]
MEPFDESLANRVSVLSDEVDELTEKVVDCRKSVPAAYSEAVQKRSSALNKLMNGREEQRRKRLRARKQRLFFPALAKGEPLADDADARNRAKDTAQMVQTQLVHLSTSLPERRHAVEEQEKLVSRLRRMPR